MNYIVAIPARFASTRLPGKPLRLLGGKPIICHVVDRAFESGASQVVVATDQQGIADAVAGMNVTVRMTRTDHTSGTDRLAECAQQLAWPDDAIIVNLQGDEPFAPSSSIRLLAATLHSNNSPMATLACKLTGAADFFNPNCVKVIRDSSGKALYFSRAPIPWDREQFIYDRMHVHDFALRHIGLYAYRAGFLKTFAALPIGRLEQIECLEQLRVIEAGYSIAVATTEDEFPHGIDTEQDLIAAEKYIKSL